MVSTATHWSFFGQLVIIIAVFVGGLGILTLASLLSLAVYQAPGRARQADGAEVHEHLRGSTLGEVGSLLRIVITTSVAIEVVLALMLTPRFLILGESARRRPSGTASSIRSPPSTTPGSPRTPTGWSPTRPTCGSWCPLMLGVFLG